MTSHLTKFSIHSPPTELELELHPWQKDLYQFLQLNSQHQDQTRPEEAELKLIFERDHHLVRLKLYQNTPSSSHSGIFFDFQKLWQQFDQQFKQNGLKSFQPLFSALSLKKILHPEKFILLDGTAGTGQDALMMNFMMAKYWGAEVPFRIISLERSLITYALLQDAFNHFYSAEGAGQTSRWQIEFGDFHQWEKIKLEKNIPAASMIYLDPMYREDKKKKKAAAKKEMELFSLLDLGLSGDVEEGMLTLARRWALEKVIVKRPLKGAVLHQTSPHHQLEGKTVRFDCYYPTHQSS